MRATAEPDPPEGTIAGARQRRRVLVTGAAGQDGRYLVEHLVARGDEVVGLCRRLPDDKWRHAATLRKVDIDDHAALRDVVRSVRPDQCYHLAAHHRSSQSKGEPLSSSAMALEEQRYLHTNILSTHALLDALREHSPRCRVFLAGSCHVYGDVVVSPQTEATPMVPNSLYGVTKVAAMHLARVYREQHRLYCVTGILYNHESLRRPDGFVTSMIARAAAEASRGERVELTLRDVHAEVDWGYAGDYVQAMALMLEAERPDDLIIASGALHTVADFARVAFAHVDRDWTSYVKQSSGAQVNEQRAPYHGDISRITERLGWRPQTTFDAMVRSMVDHHLAQYP